MPEVVDPLSEFRATDLSDSYMVEPGDQDDEFFNQFEAEVQKSINQVNTLKQKNQTQQAPPQQPEPIGRAPAPSSATPGGAIPPGDSEFMRRYYSGGKQANMPPIDAMPSGAEQAPPAVNPGQPKTVWPGTPEGMKPVTSEKWPEPAPDAVAKISQAAKHVWNVFRGTSINYSDLASIVKNTPTPMEFYAATRGDPEAREALETKAREAKIHFVNKASQAKDAMDTIAFITRPLGAPAQAVMAPMANRLDTPDWLQDQMTVPDAIASDIQTFLRTWHEETSLDPSSFGKEIPMYSREITKHVVGDNIGATGLGLALEVVASAGGIRAAPALASVAKGGYQSLVKKGAKMFSSSGSDIARSAVKQTGEVPSAWKEVLRSSGNPEKLQAVIRKYGITRDRASDMAQWFESFYGAPVETLKRGAKRTGGVITEGVRMITSGKKAGTASQKEEARVVARLARQADLGSARAGKKLAGILKNKYSVDVRKMELSFIKEERRSLDKWAFQGDPGVKGRPTLVHKVPDKKLWDTERKITKMRESGNVHLALKELSGGKIMTRPFSTGSRYLKINSIKDADKMIDKYIAEAKRYMLAAARKSNPTQKKAIINMLGDQPKLLAQEIGDAVNMPVSRIEALGYRMLLHDVGAAMSRSILGGKGYKFAQNHHLLRFWKMALVRESARSTLSLKKLNATKAFARLATKAPKNSPGLELMAYHRIENSIPMPSPRAVETLATQLSSLDDVSFSNKYFNKIFSPGGMKLDGVENFESFDEWNKVMAVEDFLDDAFVNSALSRSTTFVRNITETFGNVFYGDIEEFFSAIPAALRGSPDAVTHMQAGLARVHGHFEAMADVARFWKRGRSPKIGNINDFMNYYEVMMNRSKSVLSPKALEHVSRVRKMAHYAQHMKPVHALGASDAAMRSIDFRAILRQKAMWMAAQAGKGKGRAFRKELYEQLVDNPLEGMKVKAFTGAEKSTFQQPFNPSSIPEKRILQPMSGTPFLRFLTPFIRTPYQVIKEGYRKGPTAILSPDLWRDFSAGGARRDYAMTRAALGTGLTGWLVMNMPEDMVTGAVPNPKTEHGQWYLRNQMPGYSIRVPGTDKWLPYQYLGPARWILGAAANLRTMAMYTDWESQESTENFYDAVMGTGVSIGGALSDTFFLDTLFEAVGAIDSLQQGGVKTLGRLGENILATLAIPGAVREVNDVLDGKARIASTFTERMLEKLPIFSEGLPEETDPLGYPKRKSVSQSIFGWSVQDPHNSPVIPEMRRVHARLKDVPTQVFGLLELNSRQKAEIKMIKEKGIPGVIPGIEERILELYESRAYRGAIPEHKKKLIEDVQNAANDQAVFIYASTNEEFKRLLDAAKVVMKNKYEESKELEEYYMNTKGIKLGGGTPISLRRSLDVP